MRDIIAVAKAADFIVNGYAFTKEKTYIKVLNLNNPTKAVLLNVAGEVLETSMDDVEIDIVLDYFNRNRKYLEV